jgi:hypothetical protein
LVAFDNHALRLRKQRANNRLQRKELEEMSAVEPEPLVVSAGKRLTSERRLLGHHLRKQKAAKLRILDVGCRLNRRSTPSKLYELR